MLADAALVAAKDLHIEARSRVATNQVAPFALLVLVLFAFAFDADRAVLTQASAGLFWLTVSFSAILAVQRSFAIEDHDGASDGLRLAGLDPAGVFLGKGAAIAGELVVLEAILVVGVVVLYGATLSGGVLLVATCLTATIGLAAAGTAYGALSIGARARETLLPLLFVPVVAPVVLAATRATEAALAGSPSQGWAWLRLLIAFAAIELAVGIAASDALLEADR